MKLLVFDTETTGLTLPSTAPLEKQPKVIELGLVVLDGLEEIFSGNWLVNPGELISAEITKITGITNDQLVGMPSFAEVWEEASGHFVQADGVLAHNLPFDKSLVDFECRRITEAPFLFWPSVQICSVQEYVHVFGRRPKLKDLYEQYTFKKLEQTHRALDDVRALVEAIRASGLVTTLNQE